jgi:Holliday junction DNA helicase RuvB
MRNGKFHIGSPSITVTKPRVIIPKPTVATVVVPKLVQTVHSIGSMGRLEGQNSMRQMLQLKIVAFQKKGRPVGHWLFSGPSGLGKTAFAKAFVYDLGVPLHYILGNRITKWSEIASILKTIQENDVLFIDETHALPSMFQNNLYDVMVDFKFNEVTAQGVKEFKLPQFSIFAATTHVGSLNEALRNRFTNSAVMVPYTRLQLANIIKKASEKDYKIDLLDDITYKMANLVMGNPRRAEALLQNLVDVSDASDCLIDSKVLNQTLQLMNFDPYLGLDYTTRKYLFALYSNGSMGKTSISNHINEEEETVEAMERFLWTVLEVEELGIRGPLITKSSGRKLSDDGKKYIAAITKLKSEGWFQEEVWF